MTLSETVLHEKSARAPALVAVTSTSGRHRRVPRPVRRASGVVLAIGIWQLLSGVGVIDTAVLDSPLHVATTGWQLIRNGELPSALGVSLQRVAKGLLLGGVIGGGPAEQAGLAKGDVIIEIAGQSITNIYDYTYALELLKIGQPAKVVYMRGNERRETTLTPAARK